MTLLESRGYSGSVEVDMDRGVLRGKILFINDLVTFEAETPSGLASAFEDALDDYLETCKMLGRAPMKPASGSFNVRIGPERHRRAQVRAQQDSVSLNEVVSRALDCYLSRGQKVRERHVEKHFINLHGPEGKSILIPGSEKITEEARHVHIAEV